MIDFNACSKPCYFVRYVGTETLPETTAAKLQLKNSSFVPWDFPVFAAVENSRSFSAVSPQVSILSLPGCIGTYPATLGWIWSAPETSELPNPALVNEYVCETESVRKKIENHPTKGYIVTVYLFALVMWTLMKLAHDWALLAGVPEEITLLVGVLSWVFQLLASCAAFSWAAAATQVFISKIPEGSGACYYQLAPFATLTALGVPLLLLYLTHVKMKNLVLSLAHGDYLHYKILNVPCRAAQGTAASHLLLTKGLPGDFNVVPAPHQQLPFRNVNRWRICARSLRYFYDFMLIGLILPFASGGFFLRITEMAVSHEWSLSPMVLVKFFTMLAAASTPIIGVAFGAWMFFTMIQEVFSEWSSLRDLGSSPCPFNSSFLLLSFCWL